MAAGSLPGNLPEPGEGLRSLRKPYRRHKKGSYVCRLIWAAHLDDYPTADPISGEKRIAGPFLPPPPLAGAWVPVVSWGGWVGALSSLSPRATADGGSLRNSLAGARGSWLASDLPVGDGAGRAHVTLVLPSLICYFKKKDTKAALGLCSCLCSYLTLSLGTQV